MLPNIWLKRNLRPVTEWPEQVIGRESPVRGEYLQAIRAADEGDDELFFELHRRFTRGFEDSVRATLPPVQALVCRC
jgi:hypothetical protein